MKTIKMPLTGGTEGAENRTGYYQNTPPSVFCQVESPVSWLIRSNFIESLVSKPYTRKNSLKVDFLLILADFFEQGADHVCN